MEYKSLQHKHMLPTCVEQIAPVSYSRSVVFIFHFEHRRRSIMRLSQYELSLLRVLGAPGIMIAAGWQLSVHVG